MYPCPPHKDMIMDWDVLSYIWLVFCLLFFLAILGAWIADYIKRDDDDKM